MICFLSDYQDMFSQVDIHNLRCYLPDNIKSDKTY